MRSPLKIQYRHDSNRQEVGNGYSGERLAKMSLGYCRDVTASTLLASYGYDSLPGSTMSASSSMGAEKCRSMVVDKDYRKRGIINLVSHITLFPLFLSVSTQ